MEWRAVVGYEGLYEISSTGRVRSLPRIVKHWTGVDVRRPGRVMKLVLNSRYLKVNLSDNGMRMRPVHVLVAEAFIGPRPQSTQVRHLDGDSLNNRARNISYGTAQQNSDDRVKHGNAPRGEAHTMAKLTDAKVRRIRKMLATRTNRAIAEVFGMSNQQISNIRTGKSWAHVK